MNNNILIVALVALAMASCHKSGHIPDTHEEHEEPKFQYTSYSNDFEAYAEADAFVVGETANVLSYFSTLPDFKPIDSGKVTMTLAVDGKESKQTLEEPIRKGIFSFAVQPETQGQGSLKFEIATRKGNFEVIVPEVTVFASEEEAHEAAENLAGTAINTTTFTKEQSWKIDFSTALPAKEPFGEIIKTTALIQSSQGNEMMVTSKTNGIVTITANNMLEGREVQTGQVLFSISGSNLADNNISVRYSTAKSNFDKATADYERATELAKDKIVSEKDLLAAKNQYENAKAVYDNLNKNFTASGQSVTSPMSGFIKQVYVKNGMYVEEGQPIVSVAQNKTLILNANLPQKYAPVLGNIISGNIRSMNGARVYSFEQLNAKVLSYGKAGNSDNFLIPMNIQINNTGNLTAGSFVEIYLKTRTNVQAITVPNTALMEEQGYYFVWVQVNPELFEKREVTIGKTDGMRTEIIKGIAENERIVNRGAMLIKLAQATGTLDAHSGHVH